MKRPGFFEGVIVAVIASVAGSALFTGLVWFFGHGNGLELIITTISLTYILYLLARSRENAGRIVVFAACSVIAGFIYFLPVSLTLFVLVHVTMLWLVRSLYFYSSILSALADLGLHGVSLASAIWAATHTHSLFLSIWCFFLLQALFVFIPTRVDKQGSNRTSIQGREDTFERAYRTAEAALRKLSSTS